MADCIFGSQCWTLYLRAFKLMYACSFADALKFLMATTLRMYATCQQLQAQAQAHAAAASGLLGHTELRLHMPPSIALATRGRLQGLRLQLALLDREFDDLGMVFKFRLNNKLLELLRLIHK